MSKVTGISAESFKAPAHLVASHAESVYRRNYRTVMVRFWRESEAAPWRATALNPGSGKPQHYASVAELFADLWTKLNGDEQ